MAAERGHPGALQVPDRRPAEVVRDLAKQGRPSTRGPPRAPEALDRPPLAVEDPRDDLVRRALDSPRALALAVDDGPQGWEQREHAAVAVLRLPGLQPEPGVLEVHVLPLAGEKLVGDAPAGKVGDLSEGLKVFRQEDKPAVEVGFLEEACPRVALLQHRYVRATEQRAGDLGEPEHPLEGREFTVDSGVGGARLLAPHAVGQDAVRRDRAARLAPNVARKWATANWTRGHERRPFAW
jgi:hypothetical protein